MNCDEAKSLLGWFFDGELSSADRNLVAEHVAGCSACAAELAELTELDGAAKHLVAPEPPAGLWDQIADRLIAREQPVAIQSRTVDRRHFLLAGGVLAASVVGGVGLLFARLSTRKVVGDGGSGGPSERDEVILANLALLSPEDRPLAEAQRICASDECDYRLGIVGPPVKVVVLDKPAFFCCEICEAWGRDHPTETVAKLHSLALENQSPKRL